MIAAQHNTRIRSGFTLVELSIVLVILGLLVGGILAGRSLVRAAELRSVISEYQRFAAARETFRGKYMAMPGDMRNATAFWGAADGAAGSSAACFSTASTTVATCNGNGDGALQSNATTRSSENYRHWQHLANAGLIEGQYTGAPNGTFSLWNRYAAIAVNIPKSRLGTAGWYTEAAGNQSAASTWAWPGEYGNPIYFGSLEATDITEVPALRPEEAWNIDTKLDDGRPAYGRVRTYKTLSACISIASADTAEYLMSSASIACHLVFIPGS